MQTARLLLADSHPVVHDGLRSLFAAAGPDWQICATASDGPEAVTRAVALRPDIVIMDHWLPRLSGLEAATQIRQRAPRVEVLLFCDARSPHVLWEIFHSKVRGCLHKHEAPGEILIALEAIRHHHRFRSCALTAICDENAEAFAQLGKLTERELETLRLIAKGRSTKQIAQKLGRSVDTFATHRSNLLQKLNLHSVADLVRYAIRIGLVEL